MSKRRVKAQKGRVDRVHAVVRQEEKYINWKHILALFCALSVFIPWILEVFGVHVPRKVEKASTWIGVFGLLVLLALVFKDYLDRRYKN